MAKIAVSPFVLSNSKLTIGTDEYTGHVSSVELTPNAPAAQWKGLDSVVYNATGPSTWTVTLNYAQDWATTNSLSRYLFTNEGQTKAFRFDPISGAAGFTLNALIVAGAVGGAVDSFAAASVTLQCDKPVYVAAV